MKILSIIGARPQFIKAGIVSNNLRDGFEEILVHTGQHYDDNMSKIFFEEMNIPRPDYNLEIGSGPQGKQTGQMLEKIEEVLIKEKPDLVIVYGDTNSTLAGALAAQKMHIPIAHVEAGLRSFDKTMPEEINRILTDRCADILFCPTDSAITNLKKEGITKGTYQTGDVMYDASLHFSKIAEERSDILDRLDLKPKQYMLATIHRPVNTDIQENLKNIFDSFIESSELIVIPLHPRTKKALKKGNLLNIYKEKDNLVFIEPIGYLDMLVLEKNAKKILTDSGGVQKEAFFLGIPCITLRDTSEWVETIEDGWNVLVSANKKNILKAISNFRPETERQDHYGSGNSVEKIINIIKKLCQKDNKFN